MRRTSEQLEKTVQVLDRNNESLAVRNNKLL